MNIGLKAVFVIVGVGAYLLFGIGARLKSRRSPGRPVGAEPGVSVAGLAVGALTGVTALVLLRLAPGVSIPTVGWSIAGPDLVFMAMVLALFGVQAVGGRALWRRAISRTSAESGATEGGVAGLGATESRAAGLLPALAALTLVAVCEEFLYRGFIRVIVATGPIRFILLSTGVFVLARALSGRVTLLNLLTWVLAGITLGFVYIVSRSIWVAALVHLVSDITDVDSVTIPYVGRIVNVKLPRGVGGGAPCRLVLTVVAFFLAGVWYLFFAYQ